MRLEEKFWEIIKKQQTDRPTECAKIAEDFAIRFADWKDKLKPSQKVGNIKASSTWIMNSF